MSLSAYFRQGTEAFVCSVDKYRSENGRIPSTETWYRQPRSEGSIAVNSVIGGIGGRGWDGGFLLLEIIKEAVHR